MVDVSLRVVLNRPEGGRVIRDVVDGLWSEPVLESPDTEIGGDCWALPGLVDAHAHLGGERLDYVSGTLAEAVQRARGALAAGLTLLLDKGWSNTVTMEVIAEVPADERPEIEAAARIMAPPDGYYPGFAREVTSANLTSAVIEEAAAGAGWVKLAGDWPRQGLGPVANFTEAQLAEVVEIAESVGARVAIHAMAREAPSMAVAAGVHSIEHGMFLTEEDLAALGERSGTWVPTVLRCEALLTQLGAQSSGGALFIEGLEAIRRNLPVAIEAGVHVLAGTDLVGPPSNVVSEAVRLGDYGLTNSQALAAVSTAAFRASGRDGAFSPGTPADAVLFPANPLKDLAVLTHPRHVVRTGRVW